MECGSICQSKKYDRIKKKYAINLNIGSERGKREQITTETNRKQLI